MRFFELTPVKMAGVIVAATLASGCGGGGGGKSAAPSNPGNGGNGAPTIQGQPGSSVVAGQAYSFQPSASDPNGDTLTFSSANLPAWASLNTTTGRVTGTPTAADVGSYGGITITVSDGTAQASLGPFSIAVNAMGTGTASLSWQPPTQNSDGSALTDLAGYEVWYGSSTSNLSQVIALSNPSLSSYVVENLPTGTWYFAVVALNSRGGVSALSNTGSKTIS